MSAPDSEAEGASIGDRFPTVTKPSKGEDNLQMNAIGWIIFLVLLIVALPLLPFIALVWLLSKLFGSED